MSKRIGAVVAVILGLTVLPAMANAESSPWTSEVGYSNRAIGKLGFGLKNTLLGWTDLFVEPKEALNSGGNFFVGLGAGVKDAVLNTLGGALHLVTFPIPQIDVPLPEGGVQLFQ